MADFTDGDVLVSYLSSFWSQLMGDRAVIQGLCDADAIHLRQLYQNFVESVNRLSIRRISPFHKELVYPIVLRRSSFTGEKEALRFGNGAVVGPQPQGGKFTPGVVFTYGGFEQRSGLFYVSAPEELVNLGLVIVNRLFEPSVVLSRDSDWAFEPGSLAFKQDPFENPLIPKRAVAGDSGALEEEIVLWAVDAQIDRQDLYRQFGFPHTSIKQGSEFYRLALELLMKAYAGGPTPRALDSFVAALAQMPIIREAKETVIRTEAFRGETLVITDHKVYRVPAGVELRPYVVAGAELSAGQPLTRATEVVDRTIDPRWWVDVGGMTVSDDFVLADISYLGFVNDAVEVIPGDTETVPQGSGRHASFYLAGSSDDVETFWSEVQRRSREQGMFLGDLMWKDAGLVDEQGNPDFSRSLMINPMEFLATKVLGDGLIVVKIRLGQFDESIPLFQNLKSLRNVIPAWCALVVFIDLQVSDTYELERSDPGGVQITTVTPVDTSDLIRGNVAGFDSTNRGFFNDTDSQGRPLTPVPEALSVDDCPDMIRETLDFGDPNAHGAGIPVCEEHVWTTSEKVC